jgi:hypothetical protein
MRSADNFMPAVPGNPPPGDCEAARGISVWLFVSMLVGMMFGGSSKTGRQSSGIDHLSASQKQRANPASFPTEADILRCGYEVAYFDKADIVRWADRQIETTDKPSTELLDLAMIRDADPLEVTGLLRLLGSPNAGELIQAQVGFIGLKLAEQQISPRLAIRALWKFAIDWETADDLQTEIYHLDYCCERVDEGSLTQEELEKELRSFVIPYAEQLARDFPRLISSNEKHASP